MATKKQQPMIKDNLKVTDKLLVNSNTLFEGDLYLKGKFSYDSIFPISSQVNFNAISTKSSFVSVVIFNLSQLNLTANPALYNRRITLLNLSNHAITLVGAYGNTTVGRNLLPQQSAEVTIIALCPYLGGNVYVLIKVNPIIVGSETQTRCDLTRPLNGNDIREYSQGLYTFLIERRLDAFGSFVQNPVYPTATTSVIDVDAPARGQSAMIYIGDDGMGNAQITVLSTITNIGICFNVGLYNAT